MEKNYLDTDQDSYPSSQQVSLEESKNFNLSTTTSENQVFLQTLRNASKKWQTAQNAQFS